MPEHPLKIYEDLDPKLLELINDTQKLALADGALPRKIKLLIAMVLDAVAAHPMASNHWHGGNKSRGNQGRNSRGVASSSLRLWRRLRLYGGKGIERSAEIKAM